LRKKIRDYATLFLISGVIIILDQWSKNLVRSNLAHGEIWPQGHWIIVYARIIHWSNTGAAFGMFQNMSLVFTILAFFVAGIILYYYPKLPANDWVLRLALALQFGGAVGNLIDRLTIGHVTDFLSVGNFAVFNVADAAITTGTVILAISLWMRDREERKQLKQSSTENQNASEDQVS